MSPFLKKFKIILASEIKALIVITTIFLGLFLFLAIFSFFSSFLGLETKDDQMIKQITLIELVSVAGIIMAIYFILHLHAHLIILYHVVKFTLKKIPFSIWDADHESIVAERRTDVAVLWRFTTSPFGSIGCYPWLAFVPGSSNRISVSKLPVLGLAVSVLLLISCFFSPRVWNISFFIFYLSGYLCQVLSGLQSFQNQWQKYGAKVTKWPFENSS